MLILKSKIDKNIADAKNLLTKVIEAEYETVFIIGMKGDKVFFKSSAALDCITKLGMLEAAKLDFWREWE